MWMKMKWKASMKEKKSFWICLIIILLIFVVWEWNGQVQLETEQTWVPINDQLEISANVELDLIFDQISNQGPININIAGEEELTRLPGIGPAKAKAIISYREEHGHFETIEEIGNVHGIGPATLEQLKEQIVLETK